MSGCDPKIKTEVEIMWTNQHGTGPKTDDRVETQVILQYMCQAYPEGEMATNDVNKEFEYHTIRNGQSISSQAFTNGARENAYIRRDRGIHEPANYYQAYFRRERNKGKGAMKGIEYRAIYRKHSFYRTKKFSINAITFLFATKTRHVKGFELLFFEIARINKSWTLALTKTRIVAAQAHDC